MPWAELKDEGKGKGKGKGREEEAKQVCKNAEVTPLFGLEKIKLGENKMAL